MSSKDVIFNLEKARISDWVEEKPGTVLNTDISLVIGTKVKLEQPDP